MKRIITKLFPNGKSLFLQLLTIIYVCLAVDETIILIHTLSGKLYNINDFLLSGILCIILYLIGLTVVELLFFNKITKKGCMYLSIYVWLSIIIVRVLSFVYGLGIL